MKKILFIVLITLLIFALPSFANTQTEESNVALLKSGTQISVRVPFDESNDIYHLWEYPRTSGNKGLNLVGIYTCSKSVSKETISGTLYKTSGDDVAPLYLNSSYVGGSHGYYDLIRLTVTGHGKAIEDIGSVWLLSEGIKRYIILDIVDSNTLTIFSDFTGDQFLPTYYWSANSGTLTHISGATNTTDIVFTAAVKEQLYPNTNNKSLKIVLDGKEIVNDGLYFGDKLNLIETYNITDIPSIQQFLKDGVGSYAKPNLEDSSIDGWVTVANIFSHGRNGSITIKTAYLFLKETVIQFYGATQSMSIGEKAYVPDVGTVDGKDMSTVVTQGENTLNFLKTTWLNQEKPPYRYHQFNNDLSKGIAIGYNTQFGIAKPNLRKTDAGAGNIHGATKKMYPFVKVSGTASAGDYHEVVAFRVPLRVIDTDATCLYWYWFGDDIYLAFDYHKNINKIIKLPSYMAGMKVEVIDINVNTTVLSEFVSALGIKVQIQNNYGYAVLKLSN